MLQELAKRSGFRYLNVNLELSRQLLDFTERRRALQVSRVLSDIAGKNDAQVVLLDNTEARPSSSSVMPMICVQQKI